MADDQLAEAIKSLERNVAQLCYARGEIGARIRQGYADALDAAQAELERRRT